MRLSALLDPDAVPPDADGTVTVLLDVTAPGRAEGGLLAGAARAVSLRVPVGPRPSGARVVGGTPSRRLPDGSVAVELGDFRPGERRRLLLRLEVPGLSVPGAAAVTVLEAGHVDPATPTAHTAVLPVTVDVVPEVEARSEAAARSAGPEAGTEGTRTDDASRTAEQLHPGRSGHAPERGRGVAPPHGGVIRGEQTDRGRPAPDRAPPAPGGRRGPGAPRDPEPPPNG
ncbi:hypothetical protein ACIRPH_15540 [Nocardiopsis sp. NPDC101807]|uniref:hypothetical protein n=1 Tax=Nocardiopsis sp. NPDC101807 TaxID=3364339 RepID=UPI0037FD190F